MSHQIVSILVIDDEDAIRNTLSLILADEGYLVETAKNGKEAVKISNKTAFDLALVDIELPDVEGTELLSRLKESQPKMATIIVTGHPSIENVIKSINNKVDGYIIKPFNVTMLLWTIKKVLAEKTNSYFQMLTEVERAKSNTPILKYTTPDNWHSK